MKARRNLDLRSARGRARAEAEVRTYTREPLAAQDLSYREADLKRQTPNIGISVADQVFSIVSPLIRVKCIVVLLG